MIERIIDNWLDNVGERQFTVPFCQLLNHEGFKVIHICTHGPREQGKDILALTPDGHPAAFQVKTGRITHAVWRQIRPQLEELLDVPIDHPQIPTRPGHRSFLVTTGMIDDTVRQEMNLRFGRGRAGGRLNPPLELRHKGDLLAGFLQLHENFIPFELPDWGVLIRLLNADGDGLLDSQAFCDFLAAICALNHPMRAADVRRAAASMVVLSAYALSPYALAENHVAVAQGWVVTACQVMRLAERSGIGDRHWLRSYQLALHGAMRAVDDLAREALDRSTFIEGKAFVDGDYLGYRVALVLGWLAACALSRRIAGSTWSLEDDILGLIEKRLPQLRVWGEGAHPHLTMIAILERLRCRALEAEALVDVMVKGVTSQNVQRAKGLGLASPYYSVEQYVSNATTRQPFQETFKGQAYSLKYLVYLLARWGKKQALRFAWPDITRVFWAEFRPRNTWSWFDWRCRKGTLVVEEAAQPQEWLELLKVARRSERKVLPKRLVQYPAVLPLYLVAFPHRAQAATVKFLEDLLSR